jgi:hypothetical protein
MQGIYNYIPETNDVSRVCNVAAILLLQCVVRVMLFPTIKPFVLYYYYYYYYYYSVSFLIFLIVILMHFSF